MAETKPIPVRLGESTIGRLDAAAERIGNNRAALIRFLVESWLTEFEKSGKSMLPPNWQEIMASQDQRTTASRSEVVFETRHHGSSSKQTGERSKRAKEIIREMKGRNVPGNKA